MSMLMFTMQVENADAETSSVIVLETKRIGTVTLHSGTWDLDLLALDHVGLEEVSIEFPLGIEVKMKNPMRDWTWRDDLQYIHFYSREWEANQNNWISKITNVPAHGTFEIL